MGSRTSSKIVGTEDWADTADSDLVIVTSRVARKPGMARDSTHYPPSSRWRPEADAGRAGAKPPAEAL